MTERTVLVGESVAAVQLGVVAELLLDAGHADEDHRDAGAVVLVAEPLDRVAGEAFRLVDDDQLEQGRVGAVCVVEVAAVPEEVFLDAVFGPEHVVPEVVLQGPHRRGDLGRVEDGPGAVGGGVRSWCRPRFARPTGDERADAVPVRVAACGEGLTDAGRAKADADGVLLPDRVGELRERRCSLVMMNWLVMTGPPRRSSIAAYTSRLLAGCGVVGFGADDRDAFADLPAQSPALSVPGGLDLLEADRLGLVLGADRGAQERVAGGRHGSR